MTPWRFNLKDSFAWELILDISIQSPVRANHYSIQLGNRMARTINSHIVLLLVTQNHRTAYVRKWCIYHFDKNTRPISRKNDLQSLIYMAQVDSPPPFTPPLIRESPRSSKIHYLSLDFCGRERASRTIGLKVKPDPKYRLNFIRNGNVLTLSWIGIFYIWKGSAENWTRVSQVHSLCSYHDTVMPLDWNWLRNGVDLQYPRGNWSFESLA